jgi:hypothetical protein
MPIPAYLLQFPTTTSGSNYTILPDDFTVIYTGSSSNTFTLPVASNFSKRVLEIKNSGTTNLTLAPNGTDTIDGANVNETIYPYESYTLQSIGTGWIII